MAKTRSQSRSENDRKVLKRTQKNAVILPKKIKQKKAVAVKIPNIMNCVVNLDRLTQSEISRLTKTEVKLDKKYNFRKRETVPKIEPKPKKSLNQIVAMSQAALHTSKAIRMWDISKKVFAKSKVDLSVGQVVCGRMSGHRPWPAKIESFEKNGVMLKFYGTNEKGIVKKAEIIPCESCKEILEQYLKVPNCNIPPKTLMYHLSFVKACREVNYV